MNKQQLHQNIKNKKSFLCVGLDPDLKKIPAHLHNNPDAVFEFCKKIVDATHEHAVAFKPNTAFFEAFGSKGWDALERTVAHIKKTDPDLFIIADAKRGDIGNTSAAYATCFFDLMNADAVTVAPYMGKDSVEPFLNFKGKWAVVLGLTSNDGANDFQLLKTGDVHLYQKVLQTVSQWGTPDNLMFVVGATKADLLKKIRTIIPDHFLLIPGVGAQGGSIKDVALNGMNSCCGLLVNASRSILYAGTGADFQKDAKNEARKLSEQMAAYL